MAGPSFEALMRRVLLCEGRRRRLLDRDYLEQQLATCDRDAPSEPARGGAAWDAWATVARVRGYQFKDGRIIRSACLAPDDRNELIVEAFHRLDWERKA